MIHIPRVVEFQTFLRGLTHVGGCSHYNPELKYGSTRDRIDSTSEAVCNLPDAELLVPGGPYFRLTPMMDYRMCTQDGLPIVDLHTGQDFVGFVLAYNFLKFWVLVPYGVNMLTIPTIGAALAQTS